LRKGELEGGTLLKGESKEGFIKGELEREFIKGGIDFSKGGISR